MKEYAARCGIYCGECEFREETHCLGCVGMEGKLFWGECPLARCCTGKGLQHCGQCADFPCDKLKAFAYDSAHGDGGQRIRNLEAWNAQGFEAWAQGRS